MSLLKYFSSSTGRCLLFNSSSIISRSSSCSRKMSQTSDDLMMEYQQKWKQQIEQQQPQHQQPNWSETASTTTGFGFGSKQQMANNNKPWGFHYPIKINDLNLFDLENVYSDEEKINRCKLASVYRLVEKERWTMSIYNHITCKANDQDEHFLINPFGLRYDEITASSLLKVNIDGDIIDPGTTELTFNMAGYVLHSAIHEARPDLKAVIHIHHPACIAVSASNHGFQLVSQESSIVGNVSYHDYCGILIDMDEREQIVKNLGRENRVMILKNHGIVVGGRTIEEAFSLCYQLILACESQSRMMISETNILDDSIRKRVQEILMLEGQGLQGMLNDDGHRPLSTFELEFESRMRMLDQMGLETGYPYRQKLYRKQPKIQ